MKVDELYPSRFLKASDLQGKQVLAVIEGVSVEEFDDGETKPALQLQGKKPLILNRTNAGLIAAFLGDDVDHWRGHRLVLYPAKVDFRGRLVEAIRVREPRGPAQAPPVSQATPAPRPAPAVQNPPPGPPGSEDDVLF